MPAGFAVWYCFDGRWRDNGLADYGLPCVSRQMGPVLAVYFEIGGRGARAYYDELRSRGATHHAALRQLGNRLVGILHGCLKTRTTYDEAAAWQNRLDAAA